MNVKGSLALVLATQTVACSFLMESPRYAPATQQLDCGGRTAPAVFDTIISVGGIAFGGWAIIKDQTSDSDLKGLGTLIIGLPSLIVGLVYGISAAHGYTLSSECEEHNAGIARAVHSANPMIRPGDAGPCRPVAGMPNVFACDGTHHCVDGRCVSE